jgi:GTP-binding protein
MQVSTLAYDDYIGRLGIGRIYKGTIRQGQTVSVCKEDGSTVQRKINQVFVYKGMKRTPVEEAECGDIVVLSGISDISIGETVCDANNPVPMEMIHIEETTLSMNFMVNKSPFAGKAGKYVTSRHLKERLEKEYGSPSTISSVDTGTVESDTELTDDGKTSKDDGTEEGIRK